MTNHGAAALGARTARACDGCMRRRARWHCAADDAFLCQACDASVHSANSLARRHHRVRLPTASSSTSSPPSPLRDPDAPAWLHGLRRRPRTPRSKPGPYKQEVSVGMVATASAVPDLEAEESSIVGDDEDDLLYRVPVLEPMLAELCNPVAADDGEQGQLEQKPLGLVLPAEPWTDFAPASAEADGFAGFSVPDADLVDFAADMESLLMGVDDGFDDMGFLDDEKPQVKADLGIDFDAVAPAPEQEYKKNKPDMILKLDYEAVIASWARDGGSPWFQGDRPHLVPGEHWPDFPAASRGGLGAAVTAVTGGEREARVSRYREKRRTRLFAKKIRYEVRKLNAEKRPRMKGRFVKRAAFPPPLPPQVRVMLAPPGAHGRFRF